MDNNGFEAAKGQKKIYKFNAADIFLILLIIIAASVLIYIVAGTGLFSGGEEITIEYTVLIPMIKNEFLPAVNRLAAGDRFTDSVRMYDIGEIQSVKIMEALENSTDRVNGIVRRVAFPNHSRVQVTVRAKAKKDGVNYSINGRIIMVGMQVHFRTNDLVSYGTCIALEHVKEED